MFICFQCNLCYAGYVGYTCRHLHQRIEEHKGSAIGNHLKEEHNIAPDDIAQFFKILKKCQSKFDCLIFEMFFIKELIFYSHLKMASERSKCRDLLALSFITKSISKKLLIKKRYFHLYFMFLCYSLIAYSLWAVSYYCFPLLFYLSIFILLECSSKNCVLHSNLASSIISVRRL